MSSMRPTAAGVANDAAEAIRHLNHITINPGGLTYPSDVYNVLANLKRAAAMLPQALTQINAWLDREQDLDRIRRDDCADPGPDIFTVRTSLVRAASQARRLADDLDRAFNATAHLAAVVDGDGGRS